MADIAGRTPLSKRPVFWVALVAAIVLVAIASVAVTLSVTSGGGASAEAPISDQATSPASPAPAEPTATDSAEPTASRVDIPSSCDEIYTRDLTPEFDGLVLNPEWTNDPEKGTGRYFDDDITGVATSQTALTCKWGATGGGSDRGLLTNVVNIESDQMTDLPARLQELGQTCYDELDGIRCVFETPKTDDGNAGESHFFRENIWIATHWVNTGPDGYTHDIVAALFG
ncbi:hypothetical protein [Agromyces atrinae]|uniref:DUF3558 domain-containing protein n=1 Tax=Agromyces atrinae TaxID=592376 RepID=A0A4Q2M1Q2_9MICO|nr:hypothetical protein [Agromyces atrinae]NYD68281.1 hypothetical protein [Agromyces atrinae]RXZ85658.1 hypothetical protein ESP50_14315 [Agromyces atrinae]